MRKLLVKAMLPLTVAPFVALGGGAVAHADITTLCDPASTCQVIETMGTGACAGVIGQSGNFVTAAYSNTAGTGYDCAFWVERNVNDTGWYDISGVQQLSPGISTVTQAYWNGSGYQARVCLQFIWSSTSSGVVHCSPAL